MKKCPNCDIIMNEVVKINVAIDVCPKCMGIWLDKGELEKILLRENQIESEESGNKYDGIHFSGHSNSHDDDERHHYGDEKYKYGNKRRKGGLGELFGNLFD